MRVHTHSAGQPAHQTASRAGKGHRDPSRSILFPMTPDAPSAPTPHLFPVDHATLPPCLPCGARQWLQGVTYYRCASCGYRDGPTPREILGQQEETGWSLARPCAPSRGAVGTPPPHGRRTSGLGGALGMPAVIAGLPHWPRRHARLQPRRGHLHHAWQVLWYDRAARCEGCL